MAFADITEFVQRRLGTKLLEGAVRVKRRTVSGPTVDGTWLRIECRSQRRVNLQGWGGVEAAAALTGIRKPEWFRSLSWRDERHAVWWRADETEQVAEPTVQEAFGRAFDSVGSGLNTAWWDALATSLSALAGQPSTHFAKVNSATATARYVDELAQASAQVVGAPIVDARVDEWTTAHADMGWANLTTPHCWVLDWEDWGRAPRGFDAASLLIESLGTPWVADRVRRTFAADLASRSGQVALLARAADLLTHPQVAGPVWEPLWREARRAAGRLAVP